MFYRIDQWVDCCFMERQYVLVYKTARCDLALTTVALIRLEYMSKCLKWSQTFIARWISPYP